MSRWAPPIAWVTGGAVSTAVAVRFLVAIFTRFDDLSSRIVLSVVVAVVFFPAIVIVGACVLGFRTFGLRARDYLREHRKARRAGLGCLVGYLVLLAGLVVWHGSAAGLVGLRLLLAVGFAASTTLLLVWPILAELNGRGRWVLLTVPTVCLGTGMFLFAIGVTGVGIGLVAFFGFLVLLIPHDEPGSGSKFLALCYLVFGMLLWGKLADHAFSGGTLARWVGETAIAVGVGAATALLVWRASRGARPFLRRLGTLVTVLALTYPLFLLVDDEVFGGPFAVALFPLLVWQAIRLWRWMSASHRIGVKAGADVVFALALGATLVFFLIWLANLLGLPPSEVGALKRLAGNVGKALELPPWVWACVYALLTAAFLLAALGPPRLQAVPRRIASARVVSTVKAVRRTLTMTGIGLMVLALLGLAIPPAIGPIIARQVRDTYTVAAQEELDAEAASAVYQAITAQLTTSSPQPIVLVDLLVDVHKADPPDRHTGEPGPAELDLAHRLGALQAKLVAGEPPKLDPPVPAELTEPIHDATDLTQRLDETEQEQSQATTREKQTETASELAAVTVTNLLDVIGIGHVELLRIVREYLDGLAESPLGKAFLAWFKRLMAEKPLPAAVIVEPDPALMAGAARMELFETEVDQGGGIPRPPHLGTSGESTEAIVADVVGAEQQTAHVQQTHTCSDCAVPDEPGHDDPAEEHGFGE